jgi:hypothetical protein
VQGEDLEPLSEHKLQGEETKVTHANGIRSYYPHGADLLSVTDAARGWHGGHVVGGYDLLPLLAPKTDYMRIAWILGFPEPETTEEKWSLLSLLTAVKR